MVNFTGISTDLVNKNAEGILTDIIATKKKHPDEVILLDFLQFMVSTAALSYFSTQGMLGSCFDWIGNSLSEEITHDGHCNYFAQRIVEFPQFEHPFVRENFIPCIKSWVSNLFYYSYYTGGHKGLADIFTSTCLDMFLKIVELAPDCDGVNAIDQIIAWCNAHQKSNDIKKCSAIIFKLYNLQLTPEISQAIAFHFAIANFNGTEKSKSEWCKDVHLRYSESLNAQQKMQLTLNRFDRGVVLLLENFDEIIDAITVFRESKRNSDLYGYYLSRQYSLLYPSIYKLLVNGEIKRANDLIGAFYGIPSQELIEPTNFFIIPNDRDCVTYAFERLVLHHPRINEDMIGIINAENEFLGSVHQLTDSLEFEPPQPKRDIGQPNPLKGDHFYSLLSTLLNVHTLSKKPYLEHACGFNSLHGLLWPIQQIITRKLGITFPIIHSFRKPFVARQIQKVFIWQGETQLAEHERKGLSAIFENKGIEVSFSIASESSKDDLWKATIVIATMCFGLFVTASLIIINPINHF